LPTGGQRYANRLALHVTTYRTEHDLLGECRVPADALYGIYTERAVENFPIARRPVNPALIHAFGQVKIACARTNQELGYLADEPAGAITTACTEMAEGRLDEHIVVDALQGGAGTSTNMNVNEVLATAPCSSSAVPSATTRRFTRWITSTCTSPPTTPTPRPWGRGRSPPRRSGADRRCPAGGLPAEGEAVRPCRQGRADAASGRRSHQRSGARCPRMPRRSTATAGESTSAVERLRVVNLGGTAIGTGLAAPRQYIFRVVDQLREITGLGLARAENLVEATQNNDVFVEVSGILKACASNLLKIAGDLRLLSSGPDAGLGELRLPPRQAGSSIMPGKVNPVIPRPSRRRPSR